MDVVLLIARLLLAAVFLVAGFAKLADPRRPRAGVAVGGRLLLAGLLLAAFVLVAGFAKLADLRGSRAAMSGFGVPERLAGPFGLGLPLVEIAVAGARVPGASGRRGGRGRWPGGVGGAVGAGVATGRDRGRGRAGAGRVGQVGGARRAHPARR